MGQSRTYSIQIPTLKSGRCDVKIYVNNFKIGNSKFLKHKIDLKSNVLKL